MDELEIRNLLARLAHYADRGDTEAYVALLTDDVVWDMPANPNTGLAGSTRRGRAEIAEGQRARMAGGHQGPGTDTRHVVSTVAVRVDGDRAMSDSYFQFFGSTVTQPTVVSMGAYADELVRTPEGWRLARRTITFG